MVFTNGRVIIFNTSVYVAYMFIYVGHATSMMFDNNRTLTMHYSRIVSIYYIENQ